MDVIGIFVPSVEGMAVGSAPMIIQPIAPHLQHIVTTPLIKKTNTTVDTAVATLPEKKSKMIGVIAKADIASASTTRVITMTIEIVHIIELQLVDARIATTIAPVPDRHTIPGHRRLCTHGVEVYLSTFLPQRARPPTFLSSTQSMPS
jgi:hypothetical protein